MTYRFRVPNSSSCGLVTSLGRGLGAAAIPAGRRSRLVDASRRPRSGRRGGDRGGDGETARRRPSKTGTARQGPTKAGTARRRPRSEVAGGGEVGRREIGRAVSARSIFVA